ncbi:MAG: hypothetical protein H7210_09495 [Pyrinomonadaceae bacterium]|nr:hypothetical protein [Phycisphaerales bacterium]
MLPNGDLVAGGSFTLAGDAAASKIARWDGSTWSPLGTGITGGTNPAVYSLAVLPNGNLVAGGVFTTAGDVPAGNIARWDGATWSSLGTGMSGVASPRVASLAVLAGGDVVAGGSFTIAGGVPANNIARWDGHDWTPLGGGLTGENPAYVWSLQVMPDGDLIAGCGFVTTAGGMPANNIARWNGAAWSPLGTGIGGSVNSLALVPAWHRARLSGILIPAIARR